MEERRHNQEDLDVFLFAVGDRAANCKQQTLVLFIAGTEVW